MSIRVNHASNSGSASGTSVDFRPAHALLVTGTPVVVRALTNRTLRFARPLDDPVKKHFHFNVMAGSLYLGEYGYAGIGVPLACPETEVDPVHKEALSAWGRQHAFRDLVKIVPFGGDEGFRSALELTRSIAHASWLYGLPNPWESVSYSIASDPPQPLNLDQLPSGDTYRTQRGFTSLIRLVCDQAKTFAGSITTLAKVAGHLPGLDDSALKLSLNVFQELERSLAAVNKSAGQLRPALQNATAREPTTEHAAYDRLGSSPPPEVEPREGLAASSSDANFGLSSGTIEETSRLMDSSEISLSASSSAAFDATEPVRERCIVTRAEWHPKTPTNSLPPSSPPLSSLGGSFDNITQLLEGQHRSSVTDEIELAPATPTPTDFVAGITTPPAAHITDEDSWSSNSPNIRDSWMMAYTPPPPTLFNTDADRGRPAVLSTSPATSPSPSKVPALPASSLPTEPTDLEPHAMSTSGTFGDMTIAPFHMSGANGSSLAARSADSETAHVDTTIASSMSLELASQALPPTRNTGGGLVDVAHEPRASRIPLSKAPTRTLAGVTSRGRKSPRKTRVLEDAKAIAKIKDGSKRAAKGSRLGEIKLGKDKKVDDSPDHRGALATDTSMDGRHLETGTDATASLFETRLKASRLPIGVHLVRGVTSDPRARLHPVNRKAMVVDGSALEVADASFAKGDTKSRVITNRTPVSAALDEIASANNTTLATSHPAPSSLARPLMGSNIFNTAPSGGSGAHLAPAQSAKRKRAADVTASVASSSKAVEDEPVRKKQRSPRSERKPGSPRQGQRKMENTAYKGRASKPDNSQRRLWR